jgi:FtsH-binding integral membrane protein
MVKLSQLFNEKKQLLVSIFANLIVQLGITYYVMEKIQISKDNKLLNNFFILFIFQVSIILALVFLPMPIFMKFILFTIFSFSFGIMLSHIKDKVGPDIIKFALLGTVSIFAVMFSIGTYLIMSGIKLGYKTAIFLFYSLLLLILVRLFSLFTKSSQLTKILSFIGLIIFSGYIIYDTNTILQRNYGGDFIRGSLDYYLDIINIFLDLININSSN